MDAALRVARPALLAERLGGLSILERQLFLLRRAGVERVRVPLPRPALDGLRLPDGLTVLWEDAGAPAAPCWTLSADHLVRLPALKEVFAGDPARWRDAAGLTVLEHSGANGVPLRPLPEDASVLLADRPAPALPWLLRGAIKGTDGFMARHFDRHLSLAVTRRLLDTRVTPNHVTVASTIIGVAGAAFLSLGAYAAGLAGALLVWLHSTIDGCDGELARLRFQESPLGGVLDFWSDNVVHAALFLGVGLGQARALGAAWPLWLGALAAASAAASAALAYLHSQHMAHRRQASAPFFTGVAEVKAGADETRKKVARVEDTLAQRDFIYLLVALAAAGRLRWFLWASAVGSPVFLIVLLWLHRSEAA